MEFILPLNLGNPNQREQSVYARIVGNCSTGYQVAQEAIDGADAAARAVAHVTLGHGRCRKADHKFVGTELYSPRAASEDEALGHYEMTPLEYSRRSSACCSESRCATDLGALERAQAIDREVHPIRPIQGEAAIFFIGKDAVLAVLVRAEGMRSEAHPELKVNAALRHVRSWIAC